MRRFLMSVSVATLGLMLAGNAEAKGPSGSSRSGSSSSSSRTVTTSNYVNHSSTHVGNNFSVSKTFSPTKFSGGYCYKGIHCRFWNYCCYSSAWGCNVYWDPAYSCYYYWCPSADCYYPLSYYYQAPPTVTVVVPTVKVVTPAVIAASATPGTTPPAPPAP